MNLPNPNDTIVAISTPPGRGGIGVIRISGKDALRIANSLVIEKIDFAAVKSHTIHHCYLKHSHTSAITDEVLVSIFRAPTSYTGEHVVEISAHGNPQILQQIVESAIDSVARQAAPGEFTLRAFQNGRIDLVRAEAVADLIAAEGAAFQQAAIYQLSGKLSKFIGAIRSDLLEIGALFEAYTDFPDEDIPVEQKSSLITKLEQIRQRLQDLAATYQHGSVLRSGIQVPIIGPPNAGKSSLFNAILAEERAIVTEIPGTTRDTISETIDLAGYAVRFIDTAGIREAADQIEAIGISRSEREIAAASLLLVVFDVTEFYTPATDALLAKLKDKDYILVLNKIDKIGPCDRNEVTHDASGTRAIQISASNLEGIDQLLIAIRDFIKTKFVSGSDPNVLTNSRHYRSTANAAESLKLLISKLNNSEAFELLAFDLRETVNYLEEILGRITNEEILSEIFSRFCIGK